MIRINVGAWKEGQSFHWHKSKLVLKITGGYIMVKDRIIIIMDGDGETIVSSNGEDYALDPPLP